MKLVRSLCLVICCFLLSAPLWAETAENLIENYDLRSYYPQAQGLKDLVFRMTVPGLTEALNQEMSYGKLDNVYFEVYWQTPDRWHVEVQGMPQGFIEKKTALVSTIVGYLGFVIPQKFAPRVSGYAMTIEKTGKSYVLKGEDKSNTRGVNKIEVAFDEVGKVSRFKTYATNGVQSNTFIYKPRSWSNNKWVLDRVVTETIQGFNRMVADTDVTFVHVSGFGFPEKIRVSTKSGLNNGKELDPRTEAKLEIQLSKYEVNSGKAAKLFLKLNPKKKQ